MIYSNTVFENFFFNFFFSFCFLLLNILICLTFGEKILKKFKLNFENWSPLILFYLIFSFYTLFLNLLVLLKLNYYGNYFFYFIIFFKLFILIKFNFLKQLKSIFKNQKNSKYYYLLIFLFFIISILPISDADSIFVHYNFAAQLAFDNIKNLSISQLIEFSSIYNSEIILMISAYLKSDNFGSQLNIASLLIFFMCLKKDKRIFLIFIISSPIFIYLISAQKLQLFFGLLLLLIIINVFKKQNINKYKLIILILLLAFYSSGKVTYILFTLPLCLFIFLNIKEKKNFLIYSTIFFSLFHLPIFILKFNLFENPIAPFFDSFFVNNRTEFINYVSSLRATEGWISQKNNLELYFRPFFPTNLSYLSSSLGLFFLVTFFNYNLQKKTYFFPLIFFLIIFSTGQILPRYYLESFLILSYFFNKNNFFYKGIVYSQLFIIIIFSVLFIKISYFDFNVISNKHKFMSNFSTDFSFSKNLIKKKLSENVLSINSRYSVFSDNNFINKRVFFDNKKLTKREFVNFINRNNIKYVIGDGAFYECLNLEYIDKINQINVRRNFLLKSKLSTFNIFEIKSIKKNCTN